MTAILNRTALQIVKKAFSILRVRDREEDLGANDREAGFESINDLVKHWQTQGFHLWTKTRAVLPLITNRAKYQLGTTGDYCFKADDFFITTLSADASSYDVTLTSTENVTAAPNILASDPIDSTSGWTATNSTLTATTSLLITNTAANGYAEYDIETTVGNEYIIRASSTLGTTGEVIFEALDSTGSIVTDSIYATGQGELRFTARQPTTTFKVTNDALGVATSTLTAFNYIDTSTGDYIAVILDSGDIQWSRVNHLSGSVVTMRDTIESAAALGNYVYTGSDIIDRPLSLITAQYQWRPNQTEVPSNEWSRDEYFNQPDKTSQGIVSQWHYSPQLTLGELYVWQVAQSNQEFLNFDYVRPINITDDNVDAPDFPAEWFLTLAYCVADELMAQYSVPDQRAMQIQTKAAELKMESLGFDNSDTYIQITPWGG